MTASQLIRAVYQYGNRSIFVHFADAKGKPLCGHHSSVIAKWEPVIDEPMTCNVCKELDREA